MGSKDFQWFVFEVGSTMSSASGTAPNRDFAVREMMHYTMMYGEDVPVLYWMECDGEVLVSGSWDKLAALKKGPMYTASGG